MSLIVDRKQNVFVWAQVEQNPSIHIFATWRVFAHWMLLKYCSIFHIYSPLSRYSHAPPPSNNLRIPIYQIVSYQFSSRDLLKYAIQNNMFLSKGGKQLFNKKSLIDKMFLISFNKSFTFSFFPVFLQSALYEARIFAA